MLDIMGQGDDAVVVTHVGGVYGDRDAARARFIERFGRLPEAAQRRLVLENDDTSWGVDDVLRIHEATGVRCIFDHQHHGCINPDARDAVDACCAVLQTWHRGKPKIHFSSPRIEDRVIERRDKTTGKRVKTLSAPLASQHADNIDVEVFVSFARAVRKRCNSDENDVPFDVMCEAKAKDLAVLQLREDLRKMVPEIRLQ
jgi:UV DNA damage endonuclease